MSDYNNGAVWGWNGGSCPVHPKTVVVVWWRFGSTGTDISESYDWPHENSDTDIIAFQVVKAYVETVPARVCWSFCSLTFNTEAEALDLRVRLALDKPGQGYEDMPITKWREVKE